MESLPRLFLRFLRFGALAWGGPVAQIAMVRRELVDEERWIEPERFHRTLAVYQAIPGPEAHELCVHFGMVARGRIGGLLAGLGFMLPGVALTLALAYIYVKAGDHAALQAAAYGLAPAVAALVVRATHRLAAPLRRPLLWLAAAAAVAHLFLPFYVVLAGTGIAAALTLARPRLLAGLAMAGAVFALLWQDAGSGAPAAVDDFFLSGLRAGLLTFGGAYTAIPFVQADATAWMESAQFLDALAYSQLVPAPLIVFATFVGFVGGGWAGALLITLGIFLPAFAFTLIGFPVLERIIRMPRLHGFLDGVMAGVVGLIAVTAVAIFRSSSGEAGQVVLFACVLALLYALRSRLAPLLVVAYAGAFGAWLAIA